MKLCKGNMWDVFFDTDIFMITTNPIIRTDGAVVMGKGIAAEAKHRYPILPYDFADVLKAFGNCSVGLISFYEEIPVWYFMVKNHWKEPASLEIISKSVSQFNKIANLVNKRVDLNFPGIGNGKLKREDVLPIIQQLPDNVNVWEY